MQFFLADLYADRLSGSEADHATPAEQMDAQPVPAVARTAALAGSR